MECTFILTACKARSMWPLMHVTFWQEPRTRLEKSCFTPMHPERAYMIITPVALILSGYFFLKQ
eukprot:1439286-Amphidinium_carterae.1